MNNSFTHPEFADHRRVVFVNDKAAGLQAIIAVHNTQRGPAIGGLSNVAAMKAQTPPLLTFCACHGV